MPTLDDLANKSKRKFKKSDYRPWNYMEEIDNESNGNQLDSKQTSFGKQLVINGESDSNQLDIKKESISSESIDANDVSTIVKPATIKKSTEHLNESDSGNLETTLDTIFRLTGHQKKIFLFVTDRCASRAMLSTGVIKGETLAEITNTTSKMVKTSIQRLVTKQLMMREKGKTGRGGFYSFKLTEIVRNASLEYKRMIGIEYQLGINQESNRDQLIIKRESSNENTKQLLPSEWENINLLPLEDIGFNHNHLMDIFETRLSDPQMVQESIFHFAYGLEHESSKYEQYDDVLNVLIGRLRKGKPWFTSNYRSPQELAQIQLLERKKNEIEQKKKIEDEAYKLALAEWQDNLTSSEIAEIAPEKKRGGDLTPQSAKMSIYFKEKIWPIKKTEYLLVD